MHSKQRDASAIQATTTMPLPESDPRAGTPVPTPTETCHNKQRRAFTLPADEPDAGYESDVGYESSYTVSAWP